MRRIFTFSLALLLSACLYSQVPKKMSYQAVVRNSSNQLIANKPIGMRISILKGSVTGNAVYSETQTTTTNSNGLATLEIGGSGFEVIDWSNDTYFIKIETDVTGGSNYTISGTSQLLSVPFALYSEVAKTVEHVDYNSLSNLPLLETSNWNTAYSWGNHAGLYRSNSWIPSWDDVTGKPNFSAVANSGSYDDLSNLPTLSIADWNAAYEWGNHTGLYRSISWVPSWNDVTEKPVFATVATSGSYDDLSDLPNLNIANWNTAYSWGNHAGLYRSISWVPAWADVTGKPTFATVATSGNYNDLTNKPVLFSGSFANLTNKPTTIAGYGITDAFNGTWASLTGKPTFATVATSGSYTDLTNKPTTDGSETKITAGTNVTITGSGTAASPYVVNAIPSLTQAQRDALTATEGMVVYNLTKHKPNYYNGTEWMNYDGTSAKTLAVGVSYQGGIIAYVLQSGDPGYDANVTHGIIAAPSDQSTGAAWGCQGTVISGADGIVIGTGNQNTLDIVAGCSTASIAAQLCSDLVLGGYSDWYLPSKDELNKLYLNKTAIGGFVSDYYWSSSEVSANGAWYQNFDSNNATQNSGLKGYPHYVRAIRTF